MDARYSKEEYLDKINKSTIFDIDKECDFALYQEERNRFIVLLYEYYEHYVSTKLVQEFGLEFMNAVEESLKYYNRANGEFTRYFSVIFKQKYSVANAKQKANDARGGIHITDEDSKLISKISRLMKAMNIEELDDEKIEIVASALAINKERLIELLNENARAVSVSHVVITEEGEVDLFDKCTFEDDSIEQKDLIIEKLNEINEVFNSLQNRGKPNQIISTLLTIDIIKSVSNIIDIEQLEYRFINKSIIKLFKEENSLPSNKDIAATFDVSEPSLSRTYSSFKKKLID